MRNRPSDSADAASRPRLSTADAVPKGPCPYPLVRDTVRTTATASGARGGEALPPLRKGSHVPTTTTLRARRGIKIIALLAAVAVLSACGARIDTVMKVSPDGTGVREMVLTLDVDDQDEITGGIDAVDASIQRHKPASIEYSGITVDADSNWVATFTIPFDSPTDYRDKAAAALAVSDIDWYQGEGFEVLDSPFVTGLDIDESFTSYDLLKWLFDGLRADNVVSESSNGNMWENGDTTVEFNGITYEEGQPLSFEEVVDLGFDGIGMTTEVTADSITRDIVFVVPDKAQARANSELYEEYFAALEGDGVTVENSTAGVGSTWTVSIEADTADRIVEVTNKALASEGTVLDITYDASEYDPLTSVLTVSSIAECTQVCSPGNRVITDAISAPGYQWISGGWYSDDDTANVEASTGTDAASFQREHLISSAAMKVSLDGSPRVTVDVTVDAETHAAVGDHIVQMLAAEKDGAGVETKEGDGNVTYSVVIQTETIDQLAPAYEQWAGGTAADIGFFEAEGSSLFSEREAFSIDMPLPYWVSSRTSDITTTVTLPSGKSFDADTVELWLMDSDVDVDGSTIVLTGGDGARFQAEVTSIKWLGYIIVGASVLVVVAIIVLLIVFRRRIGAAIRGTAPDADAGDAGAVPPPPPPPGELPPPPPPPGEDVTPETKPLPVAEPGTEAGDDTEVLDAVPADASSADAAPANATSADTTPADASPSDAVPPPPPPPPASGEIPPPPPPPPSER